MTHCRTRLWVDGDLKTEDFPLQDVSNHLAEDGALVWVDMCNPDHDVLCRLADELGFDQHAVEDTVAHSERTKATRYASHTFLTVYATALAPTLANDLESRLLLARVSIFVLPAGIVTVRHEIDPQKPVFDIDEVVRRWDENSDLLKMGHRRCCTACSM